MNEDTTVVAASIWAEFCSWRHQDIYKSPHSRRRSLTTHSGISLAHHLYCAVSGARHRGFCSHEKMHRISADSSLHAVRVLSCMLCMLPLTLIIRECVELSRTTLLSTVGVYFDVFVRRPIPGICIGPFRAWHQKYDDFRYFGVDTISHVSTEIRI